MTRWEYRPARTRPPELFHYFVANWEEIKLESLVSVWTSLSTASYRSILGFLNFISLRSRSPSPLHSHYSRHRVGVRTRGCTLLSIISSIILCIPILCTITSIRIICISTWNACSRCSSIRDRWCTVYTYCRSASRRWKGGGDGDWGGLIRGNSHGWE